MVAENDPKKLAEELLKLLQDAAKKDSSSTQRSRTSASEDVKAAEKELAARIANNSSLQDYIDLLERQKELKKQNLDLSLQEQAAMAAAEAQISEADKKQVQYTERTKKAAAAVERQAEAIEKANKAIGPFGEALGASAILVNQLTKGHLSLFTTMGGVLDKTVGMAFAISDLNANLAKETGQVSALQDNFARLSKTQGENTIGLGDLQKALVGLNSGYQDFAFLGETVQDEIGELTKNFFIFGSSIDSTTKAFDFFGTTMNQAPRQAIGTLTRLKDLTRLVGQGIETIMKDLDGLRDPLTRYGAAAESQFIELKKLARSLGMETQDVFKVAEGFDTFQSAAERAMMLNAQFGTQLNSAFVMSLDHNQRILAIRAEFQRQGLDVNKMGRRELQMLSGALQVSEERAKRLLDTRKSLHQITKEDEAANKRIQDYRGATETIEMAIQDLLINNAHIIVDFVNSLGHALRYVVELKNTATAMGESISGAIIGFMSLPFVKFVVMVKNVLSKVAGYFGWFGNMLKFAGVAINGALAIFFAAKDAVQALGFFADENEQAQAQKRLAAGAVGAGGGALIAGPVGAAIGYMTAREGVKILSPGPQGQTQPTASDPMALPPGKETIPVSRGPDLDDFFLVDGVLHAMNEGDMVLGGTNLLGQQGGMNNNQKMVVKELTVPLTLKVGTKEFVAGIAMATDVIFDPTTVD